ncbi:hypothetical protein CASFOL_032559 [Castilleja foliolosa]|uniref:S-formylglutathione hydrolase n=1 Tax=Castilleja foliolosa TaxID=1961234 RepID=A0ABD3C1U0_9LAMI
MPETPGTLQPGAEKTRKHTNDLRMRKLAILLTPFDISVSAFAPMVNPVNCPWGQKAFTNYLGDNKAAWEEYDATFLISKFNDVLASILIDQGEDDKFLHEQLQQQKFQEACRKLNVPLLMRMQPGYDHSYYFIATFINDHIRHHAQALEL